LTFHALRHIHPSSLNAGQVRSGQVTSFQKVGCLDGYKGLKELEAENTRMKKLLADQVFENDVIKDALRRR